MRIGRGRSCFPQCLFKEGYLSGPRADAFFLGAFQFTCSVRRRLSPTWTMRVAAAPFVDLISPRWRSYSHTRSFHQNIVRSWQHLVELPNPVFTRLPGLLKNSRVALDVIFGFGSRWWHNTATLAVARNIRLYGETQTCQQMKRQSRP